MKSRGSILALCAFFVAVAVAVSGCGSSIPSGAVANVSGNPISKQAIDHWMYIEEKGEASQEEGEPVIVPNDPPSFSNCIAQVRADLPSLKKDTDSQIRADCKTLFTSLSSNVMGYLINAYWAQARAHRLGVSPTAAQVSAQLAKEKKAEFKTTAAYTAYLKESGETNADLLYQTRRDLTLQKLEAKQGTTVTAADIAAYYKAHQSTYGSPESRDMRIVLAKTDSQAKAALAALKSGKSWGVVARKYSIDPTTKDKGGLLTDVTQGQQDAALSKAAFAAPVNKLEGPVKGQFGYYVVEVIKITPAKVESLASATPTIKSTLTTQKQTAAMNAVNAELKKAYGAQTLCTAEYSMDDCHGYKAPKPTSSTTAAATTAAATTGAATTGAATTGAATTGAATTGAATTATTKTAPATSTVAGSSTAGSSAGNSVTSSTTSP
jgi:foldase protein PrsA